MCFPNFRVFTLLPEQSALTQRKYYLPPASYLGNKWRSFFCRTGDLSDPVYQSYCTFSITSASCFPKEYYSNRSLSPVCTAFSESRLMLKAGISAAALMGTDQARHRMPLLFITLHANPVSSSKQQCMGILRLAYSISRDFSLPFIWLFLFSPSFPSYSPSIFYPRTNRHSCHKHPSINCLSYKPLIS